MTYDAEIFNETGQFERVIYKNRPGGNLVGELPVGAFPNDNSASTLNRADDGDPFEFATFDLPSGRKVIVKWHTEDHD